MVFTSFDIMKERGNFKDGLGRNGNGVGMETGKMDDGTTKMMSWNEMMMDGGHVLSSR